MDIVSSLKKSMIEKSVDSKVARKEPQDTTIDQVIEIHAEESNNVEKSCIDAI